MVSHVFVLTAALLVGVAQGMLVEWTSHDYPDPRTQSGECGRHLDTESYVCDPNGLISTKDADFLDHILLNMQNDTECPCSTWSCERRGFNKGYYIAIALVRSLKKPEGVPDTADLRMGLARQFAFSLLKRKWNWQTCDEGIVIVFSQKDGMLMTMAGDTARERLTSPIAHHIEKTLARFFRDDGNVGQGLHYLVLNYRRVLDGEYFLPVMYAEVESAAAIIKVSIITSLLSTVILKLFC